MNQKRSAGKTQLVKLLLKDWTFAWLPYAYDNLPHANIHDNFNASSWRIKTLRIEAEAEDPELQASLGYLARPCLKEHKQTIATKKRLPVSVFSGLAKHGPSFNLNKSQDKD